MPPAPGDSDRAGQLFDSKSGLMLSKQVVLARGGSRRSALARVRIPAGTQIIDLSQAIVAGHDRRAHAHVQQPWPGMSREASTLIGIHTCRPTCGRAFTTRAT
jgi:hypothetical protein